jgi:hypothetical protein
MPTFRLQVLAPGRRFVGQNPDGSPRFVTFTPEYCRQQYQRNAAMLASGIPVPVCWDHRDDQRPGRMSVDDWHSQRAKGTAGHVSRYELDGSRVFANVVIPDDGDAKRAEVVRFCSPEIDRFRDGDGKDWGEVFTHIALTPRPRQHDQPPIARLSVLSSGPIQLALNPANGTDMFRDGTDDLDDENDDLGADDQNEEEFDLEEWERAVRTKFESDEEAKRFCEVVMLLRERGFEIPLPDVKDLPGLVIAVQTIAGNRQTGEEDDEIDEFDHDLSSFSDQPITMAHGAGRRRPSQLPRGLAEYIDRPKPDDSPEARRGRATAFGRMVGRPVK